MNPAPAYPFVNAPYPANGSPYSPQPATGYPPQPTTNYQQPTSQYPQQGYPARDADQDSHTRSSREVKYQPTAPPLKSFDKPPGYENITFSSSTILPPPSNLQPQQPLEREAIKSYGGITEEEVRDAAIQYASEHCCYGKDTVRDMKIKGITMSSAFHYKLETFTEKRETAWCYDPYGGEVLDTAMNGVPPGPWEIPQFPAVQFKDSKVQSEVPHTASAIACHICFCIGKERCTECEGICQVKCAWCNGSGKMFGDDTCRHCNGIGGSRCNNCQGTGQMKCRTCAGKGSLKCYVKLTTTWTNHVDDFIFEQTNLPGELIRDVTGHVAFQEEYPGVWPINHFPQQNINQASKSLLAKHKQEYSNERVLQQRHQVRIVPVAHVHYLWKDNDGDFFVYGFENKVHFPDYPQSCCFGCTIL